MRQTVPLKIALIGNGAIAKVLARHCQASPERFQIVTGLVLPEDRLSVGHHPTVLSLDELFEACPNLVVECASQNAVQTYAPAILERGIDMMIISVGALAETQLVSQLEQGTAKSGARILLPSGALAGLDGVAAASLEQMDSVTLTTRKPPIAWSGAPGVADIDLDAIKDATVIFEGSARQATLAFPKNANVAAALALAGLGMDATGVTLIADPTVSRNRHHVEALGDFGRLDVTIDAEPSPDNPKTSHLAALSIVKMLDRLTDQIVI